MRARNFPLLRTRVKKGRVETKAALSGHYREHSHSQFREDVAVRSVNTAAEETHLASGYAYR